MLSIMDFEETSVTKKMSPKMRMYFDHYEGIPKRRRKRRNWDNIKPNVLKPNVLKPNMS